MKTRVLPLWLFPTNSPLKEISTNEEETARSLPPERAQEFRHSRGYVRFALSNYFQMDPLSIPLQALPGEAPSLGNKMGYISFSHCNDALLIGWSSRKLGIDLERADRKFSASQIAKRFFNEHDLEYLNDFSQEKFPSKVLNQWVKKEALIKWQRGKLLKDIKDWSINEKSNIAMHKKLNLKVNIYYLQYKNWIMAIASNEKINTNNLRICLE